MKQVRLPNNPKAVPPLGFGCAYLIGGVNAPGARRMVDAVLDRGLRHFDVAPIYGMGTAEDVLGRALAGRRHDVTIASKVGLASPVPNPLKLLVRSLAAPLRAAFPKLAAKPRATAARPADTVPDRAPADSAPAGDFSLPFVEASVTATMRRLRTDYLDVLLLHEATVADVSEELLRYLEDGRASGRFRAVGIGSTHERSVAIARRFETVFDVYQYSWSVLDGYDPIVSPGRTHILHRSVMRALGPIRAKAERDPAFLRTLSDRCGIDLGDGENLTRTLVATALVANPTGLVLVGSRSRSRMLSNVEAITDDRYASAAGRLASALRDLAPEMRPAE